MAEKVIFANTKNADDFGRFRRQPAPTLDDELAEKISTCCSTCLAPNLGARLALGQRALMVRSSPGQNVRSSRCRDGMRPSSIRYCG